MASTGQSKWPYILGTFVIALLVFVAFLAFRAGDIKERTRLWVIQELSRRFESHVELKSIDVQVWPTTGVTGQGLAIQYRNRADIEPLIRIEKFSFNTGLLGLLRVPHNISSIRLTNMVITIPPKEDRIATPANSQPLLKPTVVVDEIICNNTVLLVLPKKIGKEPLDFEIHNLVLNNVGIDKPFDFHGSLTNAKPIGEIITQGKFGPWSVDAPGDSPVSGAYQFSNADLDPFAGIAGILSSVGKYSGQLNRIDVQGTTDTPNFSLDKVGNKIPLHTDFSATVDGTDGDTFLHPVRATLAHSIFIANGSVVRVAGKDGHIISLDVISSKARLEDAISLAVKSDKPFITGPMDLKTKLVINPGKMKVLQRLILHGDFALPEATFSSPKVREQLASLSRHGLGKPSNQDAGNATSEMKGHFHLENGVIVFRDLQFSVEGANVLLNGPYDLNKQEMDFHGELRMQATMSQTIGGVKSVFIKPFDPLYKKEGAGTVLPISITGPSDHPIMATTVFHKTLKKQMGSVTPAAKSQ
jgi:hypothetical protein